MGGGTIYIYIYIHTYIHIYIYAEVPFCNVGSTVCSKFPGWCSCLLSQEAFSSYLQQKAPSVTCRAEVKLGLRGSWGL